MNNKKSRGQVLLFAAYSIFKYINSCTSKFRLSVKCFVYNPLKYFYYKSTFLKLGKFFVNYNYSKTSNYLHRSLFKLFGIIRTTNFKISYLNFFTNPRVLIIYYKILKNKCNNSSINYLLNKYTINPTATSFINSVIIGIYPGFVNYNY
ncbi:conserved hypothetical protein [Ehrlichia chaffeensis str. Arkansas]|uniref:Uncharacterized protein n=2 Tax=Ehrlichia chaffeensis TaxID=945 RepID=Q2GF77_EHRCR|nr:unknown [Ehrlichia chaffeensis]AAK28660.1 unknown function UN2 [Ehrlichia chaffeensis]ABD45041.1 conserved hypothetical protein [Ehrlichia chaffeensis str. Arkansas]AHX07933.1 hypothetical protein ECHOSC_0062 [Ehrlichia chaffeensis str. Osceola]